VYAWEISPSLISNRRGKQSLSPFSPTNHAVKEGDLRKHVNVNNPIMSDYDVPPSNDLLLVNNVKH
jgi:hypothetical protein